MEKFKRGSTWDFTAALRVNNVYEDLRGAKVYVTLKTDLTDPLTDPLDTTAILQFDYVIPSGPDPITVYPISIDFSYTAIPPGKYWLSIQYKLASGKVHEPYTEKIIVEADGTNRTN